MADRQHVSKVAGNLRNLRQRKKLTQMELARLSGVPQQVISHYESGRNAIGVANLARLARALGCGPQDIDERSWGVQGEGEDVARRMRYIQDDLLLFVVDNWEALPVVNKIDLLGIIRDAVNRAKIKQIRDNIT